VGEIVDVYEYRKLLECFTVERAALACSSEQITQLKRITQVENKARPEMKELLDANEAFHLGIAGLAGNKHIVDHLRRVLEYVRRLDVLSTQNIPGWVGHKDIISALQAAKPKQARDAMTVHLDIARDRILKLFRS
jgi:DNA-binding GntR family transcriptional regulator